MHIKLLFALDVTTLGNSNLYYFIDIFINRAMLLGGLKESQQKTIVIQQIQLSTFLIILEYLYTDQLTVEDYVDINISELLSFCSLYILPGLKACLEMEMRKFVYISNVNEMMLLAKENDLHQLLLYCNEFLNNYNKIKL